mgnify:FL=1
MSEHEVAAPDFTDADREAVDAFLEGHLDELIAFRRRVHAHPEPSGKEFATTEAVASRLQIAGLNPQVLPSGTGVVCDLVAGDTALQEDPAANVPTIALRADLDALAMDDESTTPYRSTVPGVAHACGHDAHTTIVLGAGLLLTRLLAAPGAPAGRVRLIFEPAEEALPGGAIEVIEEGHLKDVGAIYGLHCDPKINVGTLGLNPGPITSAADLVEIELGGPGGHTARPELTVDLVQVMAKAAQEVPKRVEELAAGEPVKLVFGSMKSGDAANVVPSYGRLFGTLRTQDHEVWESAPELIEQALSEVVGPTGAQWRLTHTRGVPPVVNDPVATEFLSQVVTDQFGADAVAFSDQSWGGDTFAWYLETVPGSYARLGVHDPASSELLDLHASTFDIDERAIGIGVRTLAAAALSWLRSQ